MSQALIEICGLKSAAWLGIVGGALEIFGFALVATELVRAQRRELGTAGPFQFLITWGQWIRGRWRQLWGRHQTVQGAVTMTGGSDMSVRGKGRSVAKTEDLEERVKILETNFAKLDDEVDEHRQELDQRIETEAEALNAALTEFRAHVESREAAQRTAFAGSAKLQWWGIGLFVVGAGFSAAANVVGAS